MLNANGHKKYTSGNIPEAEELVQKILEEISSRVRHTPLTVVLGGSYGRGDGGVRSDREQGLLYNDLDFFVFADDLCAAQKKEYTALLENISREYEEKLNIDIDFSAIATSAALRKNSRRLMMQELKRGYVLLCGKDLLKEHLPEFAAEDLPFYEACRLLLNRGMGLLLAGEKIAQDSPEHGFILRNIFKAALGAGDALLISEKRYLWHLAERRQLFAGSALPESWKKLYLEACDFKVSPHAVLPEDPQKLWQETRAFFTGVLLKTAGAETPGQLGYALYQKSKRARECSLGNYLKYCIKSRHLAAMVPHTAPAVVNLLPQLYAALTAEARSINKSCRLYRHWQIFN